MLLRYPTSSFASSYEDLTGGLLVRFELFLIKTVKQWSTKRKLRDDLYMLSRRELADLGINKGDLEGIIEGTSDLCTSRRGMRS